MTTTDTLDRYRRSPTEAEMRQTIHDAVESLGGRVFHVRDSRRLDVTDMPDLLIVAPPLVALLELKSQKQQVMMGQAHVLTLLEDCDHIVSGIVRPDPKPGELSLDDALALLQGEEGRREPG